MAAQRICHVVVATSLAGLLGFPGRAVPPAGDASAEGKENAKGLVWPTSAGVDGGATTLRMGLTMGIEASEEFRGVSNAIAVAAVVCPCCAAGAADAAQPPLDFDLLGRWLDDSSLLVLSFSCDRVWGILVASSMVMEIADASLGLSIMVGGGGVEILQRILLALPFFLSSFLSFCE